MSVMLGAERLALWIQKEIKLHATIKKRGTRKAVRRIQEWLTFHGYGLVIDGDFGGVTKKRVQQFQEDQGLPASGIVTEATYHSLIAPLLQVLTPIPVNSYSFPALVPLNAIAHLAQHPLEVGGQNRGPWVRVYMKGFEGRGFPWCAGSVSLILKKSSETPSP